MIISETLRRKAAQADMPKWDLSARMNLQEQLCDWGNIRLAYQNASRGKRGRGATALFEMLLADHLLELQNELKEQYSTDHRRVWHVGS